MRRLLCLLVVAVLVFASNSTSLAGGNGQDRPEEDGTYDVPGHPNLKLRVIVHKEKPAKKPPATCNVIDPDSNAEVRPIGWHLPSNWTYSLNRKSAPRSLSRDLVISAQNAFSTWSNASGGKVNFTRGPDTLATKSAFDGQNIVTWGATGAIAVAYITYYPDSGLIVDTDIILNSSLSWNWTPYSLDACPDTTAYDVQDMLTHEVGHWMGLEDEYGIVYEVNTMYGYGYTGEIRKDSLTTGDILGLRRIYP